MAQRKNPRRASRGEAENAEELLGIWNSPPPPRLRVSRLFWSRRTMYLRGPRHVTRLLVQKRVRRRRRIEDFGVDGAREGFRDVVRRRRRLRRERGPVAKNLLLH